MRTWKDADTELGRSQCQGLAAASRNLPEVVQNVLAVAVVLTQPTQYLIGCHQVGGAERFSESRLED